MSWLKLKAAVMDAVCRRKLATPGEYSFVSKYVLCIFFQYSPFSKFCITTYVPRASLKECSGKVAMLDLLKLEGCAWAVIASCKGKKEDVKVLFSYICTILLYGIFFRLLRRRSRTSSAWCPSRR